MNKIKAYNKQALPSESMTPALEKLITEVEAELREDKASKAFNSADEFLADLKKQI